MAEEVLLDEVEIARIWDLAMLRMRQRDEADDSRVLATVLAQAVAEYLEAAVTLRGGVEVILRDDETSTVQVMGDLRAHLRACLRPRRA